MPADLQEKVIEETNDRITLQRPIDDDFYIIQRLLSFCPEIYYISDERIIYIIRIICIILYYKYFSTVDTSWTLSTSVHLI